MTAIALDRARLAAIHAESKRLGLDDASRRDLMEAVTGKRSSRELAPHEADRVIERLKALSNGHDAHSKAPSRPPRLTVSGPYAGKLRALWLSGYNIGVIQSKDDAALIAFAERQTGLSHTRFLKSPKDAARVIEALKAWIARDGGVVWPDDRAPVAASKRAVVTAQLRRLADIAGGRFEPRTGAARDAVTLAADALASGAELDAAASKLGAVLRQELRRRRGN